MSIALGAIIREADLSGAAPFHNVVIRYRDEFLRVLRTEGKDAEREAGRLGLDEVESYLKASILPRLVGDGVIVASDGESVTPDLKIKLTDSLWRDIEPNKREIAEVFRHTGEYSAIEAQKPAKVVVGGSTLEAKGLTKSYRRRAVVNNVDLKLRQGEIVGLLGPNGAGKTTSFYMIVGLIEPQAGRIVLDGKDISSTPMYERARMGIGYPSIDEETSMQVQPYLFFDGRCDEAVAFYRDALGAQVLALMRFSDAPPGDAGCPGGQPPPADKVMHAGAYAIMGALLAASVALNLP